MTRRGTMEIQHDILNVLSNGYDKITHIMYRCNLSWQSLQKYITYLVDNGFVSCNNKRYYLTRKGMNMLRTMNQLRTPTH